MLRYEEVKKIMLDDVRIVSSGERKCIFIKFMKPTKHRKKPFVFKIPAFLVPAFQRYEMQLKDLNDKPEVRFMCLFNKKLKTKTKNVA